MADEFSQLSSFMRIIQEAIAAPGNLGSSKMKNWIPLSNQVVEKFIYQSVYDRLFEKFSSKFAEQDGLYFKKVQSLRDFTDLELLENLEVKPRFRFGDQDGQYFDAIAEMEKMQYCQTPKDKLVRRVDSGMHRDDELGDALGRDQVPPRQTGDRVDGRGATDHDLHPQ